MEFLRALSSGSMRVRATLAVLVLAVIAGCGGSLSTPQRREAAKPAIVALQQGSFEEAEGKANTAIDRDGRNSQARAVRALVVYRRTADRFFAELAAAADDRRARDPVRLRGVCEAAEKDLAAVEDDLAVAAQDSAFSLELCPSCWRVDWNHDGKIDRADIELLQIERDAEGAMLPPDDPQRSATYHFDVGDVHWARAMVSFQRALLDVALAFNLEDIERGFRAKRREAITIRLADSGRIAAARSRILEGLDFSDRAREAYLAETDDDREWVPNPRQKSHPLPLPVDDALYETWRSVVRDVRAIVERREGIDLVELAYIARERRHPLRGYLDLGRLLTDPQDLVFDPETLENFDREPQRAIELLFGKAYVEKMKPSPLLKTLARMEREIRTDSDSFKRKLRYFFWLN
jgi:hypothetical protein